VRTLLLEAPGRLVTLAGPGGVGKTQLGLVVAHGLTETFSDGIWFIDVASVHSGELLTSSIMGVLKLNQGQGKTLLETVLNFLRTSELLLVLDSCEHVIEACSNVAERILEAAPNVRVLATSRERLRIAREIVWPVSPLPSPAPGTRLTPVELQSYPAARLFVERATALQPRFTLNEEAAESVVGICQALDGLPLAIELAAARTTAMSLNDIRDRLAVNLQLLSGGSRTAPGRQQTMRATLDWSHSLLSGAEQAVLRRLAVFSGGWTLKAAERVCTDGSISAEDSVDLLTKLVDKSLVVLTDEQDGRSHYHLLEPIRQYAMERLVESHELEDIRECHAQYMLQFAKPLGVEAGVGGPNRWTAVEALLREYPNLRAALNWAIETQHTTIALQLAAALEHVWKTRVALEEARRWVAAVLALPGADAPTRERALVLLTGASLAFASNNSSEAETLFSEASPLAEQLGDPWVLFVWLIDYGMFTRYQVDEASARNYWERGLSVSRASGDRASEAILQHVLAESEFLAGNVGAARTRWEEVLRLERQAKDPLGLAFAVERLAMLALADGDTQQARALTNRLMRLNPPVMLRKSGVLKRVQIALAEGAVDDAREHLLEALTLAKTYGNEMHNAETLDAVAEVVEAYRNNPRLALSLAAVVEAAWTPVPWACLTLESPSRTRWLSRLERTLPADDLATWRAEGRELSLDDAVALAEAEVKRLTSAPALVEDSADELTPRQRQVAVLVGQGLTNRQIARQLVVTERAAAAHIEHILDKLGANSRTEIAVWASQQGLLAKKPK
jgi:predicted ATPase/DNA-binding CsgD family transcriptional regulator